MCGFDHGCFLIILVGMKLGILNCLIPHEVKYRILDYYFVCLQFEMEASFHDGLSGGGVSLTYY